MAVCRRSKLWRAVSIACGEKRKTLRRKMHICLTVGHERPAALAKIRAKSLSGRASFMTLSTSLIGASDNADSAATVSSNFPFLAYSQTTGSSEAPERLTTSNCAAASR